LQDGLFAAQHALHLSRHWNLVLIDVLRLKVFLVLFSTSLFGAMLCIWRLQRGSYPDGCVVYMMLVDKAEFGTGIFMPKDHFGS
jgi:hypothetical protein